MVDVRQQNTVAAPTQWADADKPSKTQTLRLPIIFFVVLHTEISFQCVVVIQKMFIVLFIESRSSNVTYVVLWFVNHKIN